MRNLFFSIILVLAAITGISQKQFEGTIAYKLHSAAEEEKEDGLLSILFGKNAIRLKMKEKNGPESKEIIIRIDSGKIYTLNTEEKTFRAKRLNEKEKNELSLTGKKIAGFTTGAVDLSGGNSINALFGGYLTGGKVVFYIADSLFYFIPEKYTSNVELVFIQQDRIALGVDFRLPDYSSRYGEVEDDEKVKDEKKNDNKETITAEAISVKWETIPESEFTIPADFVKYKYNGVAADSVAVADSSIMQMIEADSAAVLQTTPAKKPAANKKQPAKPKTKTNNSKTGPIRKPE